MAGKKRGRVYVLCYLGERKGRVFAGKSKALLTVPKEDNIGYAGGKQ